MKQIAKPDLQKLVDAIREETNLAHEELSAVPREVLQRIVVRALERGVELQREVLIEQEHVTPLLPPQTSPPVGFDPPPASKPPRGAF